MRKTAALSLGIVAVAAAMIGCEDDKPQDVRACTDGNGRVVADAFCEAQPETANGRNPDDHHLRDILLYRWVFGGNYGGGYVGSGSYYPHAGFVYVSPFSSRGSSIRSAGSAAAFEGAVSRGGFGGSFAGGEGGEGGGE